MGRAEAGSLTVRGRIDSVSLRAPGPRIGANESCPCAWHQIGPPPRCWVGAQIRLCRPFVLPGRVPMPGTRTRPFGRIRGRIDGLDEFG
jgi:hypothetical protein